MSRLTRKFGDKVILPIIPMEINSKEDLEKYHDIRKEYENITIKLSEYEDREEINDCKYCCGDEFNLDGKKINYCAICGKKL